MPMSEQDARKKWCPHVRWNGGDNTQAVKTATASHVGFCIASECMMWQWATNRCSGCGGDGKIHTHDKGVWTDIECPKCIGTGNPSTGDCGLKRGKP